MHYCKMGMVDCHSTLHKADRLFLFNNRQVEWRFVTALADLLSGAAAQILEQSELFFVFLNP